MSPAICCCGSSPAHEPTRASPDLLEELLDPIDALVDLLHARREAQADVRFESAVVPRHHRDVALLQQRRREADRVADLDAVRRLSDVRADVREAVERPARADTG